MNMAYARQIAVIGAFIGILSLLLSLLSPEWFGWYRLSIPSIDGGLYLTGFGTVIIKEFPSVTDQIAILVLIGGILVIVGAVECLTSALLKNKVVGILGGLFMIVGPLLLLADIMMGVSEFMQFMENYTYNSGVELFFGRIPVWDMDFGLWIGFFMAIAGGVAGLIGGVLVER
jgi:hypothetical protein